MVVIRKKDGILQEERYDMFAFVPLLGAEGWGAG
jgi:hypothetical protein